MEDQLESIATATSPSRRPSFVVLCQQERRSTLVPEILPIAVKPLKTGGGCTPKLLTLRQAADKTTPLAEGESGSFGTELDPSAIATGSGGVPDDIADLKELISAQREDLKTAALIGQRLLDSNDELSAKLEAAREEKWVVECEKEALRRDLEHATQRCEQMQRDTRSEISPEETQMEEEFDLWSPAAAAAAAATAGGTAGASASATEQSWRSSTTALPGAAADDNDRETIKENHQSGEEMDRLKKEIKNLEQANAALREELVEARLETTALRHTSVELGEAVLDQEKRELGVEVKQGLRSGWSAPNILGKLWESDSDEAGAREDGREEASFPPPAMVVPGGTDTVESAAPVVPEARSDDDSQKEQVGQESVEKPNGSVSHTTRNDSDDGGVDRTEETPLEGAVPPESLLRRLSSSTFKDTEEQRELIEALRDQISQLQLEKQMRMAHTGKPNNTGGAESALGQYDGGAVKPSSCSKCSSDDDSGSGRDDTQGSPFGECQPRAWCSQYGEDGGSGDEDASRRRKQSGGDIENSVGRLDPAEHFILQERVSELSAELEAALKEVEALRGQARQNEAEGLELRVRELSAEVEAANKKTEALRELTKNQAQNLELRVCELSADLEAANRETEALREQAQRSQAQRLGLRVAELSAELETANKEMEALRDQARQSQAQRIGLRVDQVSAELETAYKTNDALRDQAQRSQAESVELQRELLRLQGTRDRASAVAAAVAAHSTYHGDGGESSERRSGCLDVNGFGWLRWLWIAVFCGEDRTKEEMGNRIEDSAHDDTLVEVGGELGNGINRRGSYRNGRQGRLAVDDRELLLNRDSRTMGR